MLYHIGTPNDTQYTPKLPHKWKSCTNCRESTEWQATLLLVNWSVDSMQYSTRTRPHVAAAGKRVSIESILQKWKCGKHKCISKIKIFDGARSSRYEQTATVISKRKWVWKLQRKTWSFGKFGNRYHMKIFLRELRVYNESFTWVDGNFQWMAMHLQCGIGFVSMIGWAFKADTGFGLRVIFFVFSRTRERTRKWISRFGAKIQSNSELWKIIFHNLWTPKILNCAQIVIITKSIRFRVPFVELEASFPYIFEALDERKKENILNIVKNQISWKN